MSDNHSESALCNRPPRNSATDPEDAVLSAATANAATSTDLWAAYTDHDGTVGAPKGKVWIELEVTGFDTYVRFARTGTTATTAANGALLKVGIPRRFYIEPNEKDKFMDHLSPGGIGVIKYRVCSAICERYRA